MLVTVVDKETEQEKTEYWAAIDLSIKQIEAGTAKTFGVTMEDMKAFENGTLTEEEFRKRAVVNG